MSAEVPVAALRRISRSRAAAYDGERCEMCGEPVAEAHPHVVDLESRALLCTCRGCYLLFTAEGARHALPRRARALPVLPGLPARPGHWDDLQIPVGLAFFFASSVQRPGRSRSTRGRPAPPSPSCRWAPGSPSSPTTPSSASSARTSRRCCVRGARNRPPARPQAHLVPIDACYELVGRLRQVWRGFDGGQEARARIEAFFDAGRRSRPPAGAGGRPVSELDASPSSTSSRAVRRGTHADRAAADRGDHRPDRPRDRAALPGAASSRSAARYAADEEAAACAPCSATGSGGRRHAAAVPVDAVQHAWSRASPGHRGRPRAALHLRLRGRRRPATCTPSATGASRCRCCSAAPSSPAASTASVCSRCRGTARRRYGCRSRCGRT